MIRIFIIASITIVIAVSGCSSDHSADPFAIRENAAMIEEHWAHPQYPDEIKRAKAAGLPTTLAEIFPPLPPADQNAASIYLMLGEKEFPGGPQETAADTIRGSGSNSPEAWAAAHAFVKSHSHLLDLVHQAASRTLCVMPRHDFRGNPSEIMVPEFHRMRRAARLLTIQSLVMAKDGNPRGAVRNELLCFRIANHASNENFMSLSFMESCSIENIGLHGMQNILSRNPDDTAVADAIEGGIPKSTSDRFVSAEKDELAFDIADFEYARKIGPKSLLDLAGSDAQGMPLLNMSPHMFEGFMDANGTTMIKLDRQLIDAAGLPYPEASAKFTAIQRTVETGLGTGDLSGFLSSILVNILTPRLLCRVMATEVVTRAAAAVIVYKSRDHRFPPRLSDALTPAPTDPFNDKPLGYRLEKGGFVVYSVGETGQYDGMPVDPEKWNEAVFRYPNK